MTPPVATRSGSRPYRCRPLWTAATTLILLLALAGCSRIAARNGAAQSWTLANEAMTLTITRDARGRIGMTRLRDPRTGYEWCRDEAPSPVFQVEFLRGGQRFALTGRSRFDLVEEDLTKEADGTQVLRLQVRSAEHPLELDLRWRLRPGLSPVEKWYVVANRGAEPITVFRLGTFSHLLETEEVPTLRYVHKGTAVPGTWRVHERPLSEGETETLFCSPGEARDHLDSVPWFLLDRGESNGGLLYAWAFSGTGRFAIARAAASTLVTGGLQTDLFEHHLLPGLTLEAPTGLFGPYAGAPDDAAREWHGFLRRHWAPPPADPLFPRLHYNTWYSLGLDVDEASCLRQLRAAADLGLEMFHIDAGWYRAIGDWHPDPERFPRGLRPIAQEAKRRGMKFGLWVAFTQISEQMLERRPEWITTPGAAIDPDRPLPFRSLTICLGNPVAREWIRGELERIVTEYELDMLQYDQPIIEECKVATHGHQAGDGGYAATLGFYEILDGLRQRFPDLILENCMNGGHMIDFGVLRRTHFSSLTDFRDALRSRITLYGATYPLPAYMCEGYMQDDPSLPPEFLFRSFMPGLWVNSADIASWDSATFETARRHVALYKQLRPLLREGDVYHILPQPTGRQWDGLQYYDPRTGTGVAFVFRPRSPEARRKVPLAGLEEGEYDIWFEGHSTSARVSGASLMKDGLEVTLPEPNSAAIIHLRRVP